MGGACISVDLKPRKLKIITKKGKMEITLLCFFPLIVLNLFIPKCCVLIGNVNCASLQPTSGCPSISRSHCLLLQQAN
jgi:hypothetical protein